MNLCLCRCMFLMSPAQLKLLVDFMMCTFLPLSTCIPMCAATLAHCRCMFLMSPAQLKLVVDSIVWAFRHTERNVAETGLNLLADLLAQFAQSDYATQFHQTYYLQLMQEIFAVMTGEGGRERALQGRGRKQAGEGFGDAVL